MSTHHLEYDRPAGTWLEALPLGNGRTGAMVFGVPGAERIQLNDGTAWSGSPKSEHAAGTVSAETAAEALAASRAALVAGDHTRAMSELQRLQERYSQGYLPFADLFVRTTPAGLAGERGTDAGSAVDGDGPADVPGYSAYSRRLDFTTAQHTVHYVVDGTDEGAAPIDVTWQSLVSHPAGVLQLTLSASAPLDVELELGSPLHVIDALAGAAGDAASLTLLLPSDAPPQHEPDEPVRYSEAPGDAMRGAVVVGWRHNGVGAQSTGDEPAGAVLRAGGVTTATIVLATATTFVGIGEAPVGDEFDALTAASARVAAAIEAGPQAVRDEHLADHAELYARTELVIDAPAADAADAADSAGAADPAAPLASDERLAVAEAAPGGAMPADPALGALLFHYGRYLLIAASRTGGLPTTLQGIWNDRLRAPWSSNYTVNINTEMNYWPAETANLAETVSPYVDLMRAMSIAGRETAQRLYDAPGWVAHHNTDAWAYTSPVGIGRANPSWAFWPLAPAWLVQTLWEHVRFGADESFARDEAWPVIRSAAEFALAWLIILPDGTLGTSPSTSPENQFQTPDGGTSSVGVSSAMDLTLIGSLFDSLSSLAELLDIDGDPVVAEARAARPNIPGLRVGRDGMIPEWAADDPQVEPHHRHLGQLVGVYPGDLQLTPELRDGVIRTLEGRGDDSTGWSLAWKLALRARLGQRDKVSDLLALVFRAAPSGEDVQQGGLYPNFFGAHPPFQIDGNYGYVAGVVEALLQSHTGDLVLLPAVPREWASGRVRGIVARPGIGVDVRWSTGDDGSIQLIEATLRAQRPAGKRSVTVVFGDARASVDLRSGGPVTLTATDFA
ncbi:glycosyl hydrolase family 95 catalytic domain-containing protein [Plantibacter sp. Mn2098]|uniref:glycosyl hydrolase family 95 catalytic domain-containing protein n=1 Tax=Plantibacter sp. Mn2098 TaxID=3395266 RepID=UPI003BEE844A